MDAMLRDLLVVSEIYNRNPQFAPVNVSVEIEAMKEKYASPTIRFEYLPPENPDLTTDVELLRILLDKLIENAVSYPSDAQEIQQVTISAYREGNQFKIAITDRGAGIDPVAMPDLFKMFYRGTEKSKGSGLGLFIVEKSLDRLAGSIEAVSELGSYTRMVVSLPVVTG
jgi:signal transduction histidine kinase